MVGVGFGVTTKVVTSDEFRVTDTLLLGTEGPACTALTTGTTVQAVVVEVDAGAATFGRLVCFTGRFTTTIQAKLTRRTLLRAGTTVIEVCVRVTTLSVAEKLSSGTLARAVLAGFPTTTGLVAGTGT